MKTTFWGDDRQELDFSSTKALEEPPENGRDG